MPYLTDLLQIYFNCWTLCQKANFSDKKKNLCLHAEIVDEGAEPYTIRKAINVQQNPGRGAKVVVSRPRLPLYRQETVFNADGTPRGKHIKLNIGMPIGKYNL